RDETSCREMRPFSDTREAAGCAAGPERKRNRRLMRPCACSTSAELAGRWQKPLITQFHSFRRGSRVRFRGAVGLAAPAAVEKGGPRSREAELFCCWLAAPAEVDPADA